MPIAAEAVQPTERIYKMNVIDINDPNGIFAAQEPPCLSLYQPTHRSHPDNQQDPIRFRNLIKVLETSLRQKYTSQDIEALLAPFRKLAEDHQFWNHAGDGLAVLGSANLFKVFRLQRPVLELAVAANSFHLKPLLRILQSADRYHVLGLSRHEVQLFEGNRDVLAPIVLPKDVQEAIAEAREGDRKQVHVEVQSSSESAAAIGVRGGGGSGIDTATDREAERFFRVVDRIIREHFSQPSGLPLLLAALPEHHTVFHQISRNPLLMSEGVHTNPKDLTVVALRDQAWQVIEPHYLARQAGLVEMFGAARARGLGEADLSLVMRAAVGGRVATLLIEADRQIPGQMDATTGAITFSDMGQPDVDDLLDDLAELVLKNHGQVVVVPSERMPTESGLAAIYRF